MDLVYYWDLTVGDSTPFHPGFKPSITIWH